MLAHSTKFFIGSAMSNLCSALSDNHTVLGVALTVMATGWLVFALFSFRQALRETV